MLLELVGGPVPVALSSSTVVETVVLFWFSGFHGPSTVSGTRTQCGLEQL